MRFLYLAAFTSLGALAACGNSATGNPGDSPPGTTEPVDNDPVSPSPDVPSPDPEDAGPVTDFAWVTGFDISAPTLGTPKPGLNVSYVDEHYGLTVTRVTDASQVTDNDKPSWVRHEYSRRPAFNADGTRALMMSTNGWFRLYDVNAEANTMSFVRTLSIGGSREPNWHPTDPNVFYYVGMNGQGLEVYRYDVSANTTSSTRNLTTRVKAIFPSAAGMWTKDEGRPSNDGNVWCFQIETGSFGMLGLISYRFDTDEIVGSMATTDRPDHTSTSPLGNYCVPSWTSNKGTRAYALDFSSFTQLHTTSEHSDLAVTKSGAEVYVYTDYSSGPNGGYVVSADLATGAKTDLVPLYGPSNSSTAMHISGTASAKPGYVVVGFYACGENYNGRDCDPTKQWFSNKVVLLTLEANPTVYNLAHNHYGNGGYFSETQAVANRDLSKVLFVSTWESTNENSVASYMIDVPTEALP